MSAQPAANAWKDPNSKRGAIVRIALFVAMYVSLEYLLDIALFGLFGRIKGADDVLSSLATLSAALLAGGALITVVDQRRFGALGYAPTSHTIREVGTGFALGGGANGFGALLMVVLGTLRYTKDAGTAGSWITTVGGDLIIFALAAAAEEAVFRGYGFQAAARAFGPYIAVIGGSALFAFAHSGNPNVTTFGLLNIFLAGVLLGFAYLRTMSLWFATAVHCAWNWVMASLLDLPVSGLSMFQTPLYEPVEHGAKWITGGTFGPEGGIAGSIALAGAIVVMLKLMRLRVSPEMRELRPIALQNIMES